MGRDLKTDERKSHLAYTVSKMVSQRSNGKEGKR